MTPIKTTELTGPALDWAVAKCEGPASYASAYLVNDELVYLDEAHEPTWEPSTNWSQGGPIIERDGLGVWKYDWDEQGEYNPYWFAEDANGDHVRTGPTPLVAAMRCFVASKLGDTVDIPEELK